MWSRRTYDFIEEWKRICDLADKFGQLTDRQDNCLHRHCTECNGTGTKKSGGPCVHMISCPCPKCTPSCMIS